MARLAALALVALLAGCGGEERLSTQVVLQDGPVAQTPPATAGRSPGASGASRGARRRPLGGSPGDANRFGS